MNAYWKVDEQSKGHSKVDEPFKHYSSNTTRFPYHNHINYQNGLGKYVNELDVHIIQLLSGRTLKYQENNMMQ